MIDHVHADGRLDVRYDDGDYEERMKPSLVRKVWVEEMPGLQRQCAYLEQFLMWYRRAARVRFVVYTNQHTPESLVMN